MKRENGITLIALVITIIILMILAGTSVSLLMGENGLIAKAKQGALNYQNASEEEKQMLNSIEETINSKGTSNKNINVPYDNPYIPNGFTHTEGTWNNGFTIKGNTGTANENDQFVWVPCVTDASKIRTGDNVTVFGKVTTGSYNLSNLGLLPTDTTVAAEDSTVLEIKNSVEKYGGFYIAKYEISESNGKAKSVPGITPWVEIRRVDALEKSKLMVDSTNTGVHSTLISGECWDTTLQWMVNTSDNHELNAGYDTDSSGKSYYSSAPTVTGSSSVYAVNNIYDMAGNVWEWTTENCKKDGVDYFINRGDSYGGDPSIYTSACRGVSSTGTYISVGFRTVLYK